MNEISVPDEVEALEAKLLKLPQVEIPLTHRFAPGVYMREVLMPAGTFVIGHRHNTRHLNIILSGRARVMMDGQMHEIIGPCVLTSEAGVRKLLLIEEDMRWTTIHPTNETDLDKLEEELIVKSASFIEHANDMLELEKFKLQFKELNQPKEV